MRRHDLEALGKPYEGSARFRDDRFADALNLRLREVRVLRDTFESELDAGLFGIGWWRAYEPQLGTRARIHVSDYLFRSAASIETNLIEAKLHLLEALDAHEQVETRLSRMLEFNPHDGIRMRHPPSESAKDDLQEHLATMHTAGLFRALASSFDCLGACVHGVLALSGSISSASFGKSRGAFKNLTPDPTKDLERKTFRDSMESIIATAGPAGWLEWLLDYRNTLVHRARRLELTSVEPESLLVNSLGQPILRARQVPQLPRDPGRTDTEVWQDITRIRTSPVLAEAARTTMEETLKSSQSTIGQIAALLLKFWKWRRENPLSLRQPGSQWPNGMAGNSTGFAGYETNQRPFNPSMMTTHPIIHIRMRAASLADGMHTNWPDFSGTGDNK